MDRKNRRALEKLYNIMVQYVKMMSNYPIVIGIILTVIYENNLIYYYYYYNRAASSGKC